MALSSPEQIAASQKAGLDAFFGLTGKVFEGIEKLAELNLQVVRSTLAESRENLTKAPATTDPHRRSTPQAGFTAPFAEKSLSYGRQPFVIALVNQPKVGRLAH